jgi:putative transposase
MYCVSDRPQRTNTYTAEATSDRYRQCLFDWLAAHAPLWNQINYRRRQQYFSDDGDVWDAEYTDLYDEYAPIIGKATCQQVARKNSEAWRSHFRLLDQYHDESNTTVTEKPSPPGYWGTREEGYELHGLVRNDLYTFDWDENQSTLEFGVGDVLEDRYNFEHNERATLEVRGNPQWGGDDSRLELIYEEHADQLRVQHPVRIQPDKLGEQREDAFTHTLNPENTTQAAAIDVGANNTLAVVTESDDTAVYHARPEFDRFQSYSERIATLQSKLHNDEYTSHRIQRLYDKRSRNRDHSRNAAVKHVAEWLLNRNVDTVYVGDLTDVLDTHWSAEVNEKTHAFWSHRQLLERIELTLSDVGICVEDVSEADSSSECPDCGSSNVTRNGDAFRCHDCELDAHSDVAGAWNLLQDEVGPMARPAALSAERDRDALREGAYWQWNEHDWIPAEFGEQSRSLDQPRLSEPASSQPG